MISAGLDGMVKLWDLRRLSKTKQKSRLPQPVAEYRSGRSINSAFFAPSGRYAVSTTMGNKLDVFENLHLSSNEKLFRPAHSIPHNNRTGRWLSTFMARFHPSLDLFCVGSMQQPRRLEIFTPRQTPFLIQEVTGLTAVASRCCFHPSTERLMVVGGNSSGRVTIVR